MEALLNKLARQLDSLDEASLSALWGKYADIVADFEPTKRWEEAALVFSLIQAKRWKNQLFNHHWRKQTEFINLNADVPFFDLEQQERNDDNKKSVRKAKLLSFKNSPSQETSNNSEK